MKVGVIIETIYTTNQLAGMVVIHANTVRMYEELGLISKAVRRENGYRVFTSLHLEQLKLARTAFQVEVLQNGLRKKAISIVKTSAQCDFDKAIELTEDYILSLAAEIENANEAVRIANGLLDGGDNESIHTFKRKEVSDMLGITMDALRNWEMNGLMKVKRRENGYRIYTEDDIRKLKIIRSLKCANYSLSAILRMMNALDKNSEIDIVDILNTPDQDEDVLSACDRLIVSLKGALENAIAIKTMLYEMKNKFINPPL